MTTQSSTQADRILEYAHPRAPGWRRRFVKALPRIGSAIVLLSFAGGALGGFYGNPGFPDGLRLYGALGVLIGGVLYVVGRSWRETQRPRSAQMQLALTAIIA